MFNIQLDTDDKNKTMSDIKRCLQLILISAVMRQRKKKLPAMLHDDS